MDEKTQQTTTDKKEKGAGIYLASILMFLSSPFWIIVAILQAGVSVLIDSQGFGILAIWNFFFAVASIVIGIGILQTKKWGYNWGLGTAIINTIWFGLFYYMQNSILLLFLLLWQIIIALSLFLNKASFKSPKKQIMRILDNTDMIYYGGIIILIALANITYISVSTNDTPWFGLLLTLIGFFNLHISSLSNFEKLKLLNILNAASLILFGIFYSMNINNDLINAINIFAVLVGIEQAQYLSTKKSIIGTLK